MNKLKQIFNQYDWNKAVWLAIAISTVFWIGVFKGHDYIVARDTQIYNDGYEVGRFDQLNEDAEALANTCFNISENVELNRLLKKYFLDCKTAKIMWAIAQAESSGKQFAVGQNDNGSMDGGWLQVNTIHRNPGESKLEFIKRMHNLEENIKEAKKVLDKQGYSAWVTYKTGAYKKFLIQK